MLRRIQFPLLITPDLQDFQFYAFTMKQTKKKSLNTDSSLQFLQTMLIPFASTTKMSPLPVPPFHLRPTCHLEKEAKQQSSTHQAVFHLPALHRAPTKRYYHLWLFGVTSLSREKILTSARSDTLTQDTTVEYLSTSQLVHRHILTSFVLKKKTCNI